MSANPSPTKWSLGPKTRWFLIAFAALAALAVIAVVGAALTSRARWRTQLRRIESRGEPLVLPAPPMEPTAEGARTRAWLDDVGDCDGPDDEWKLETADGLRAFRDRADWTKLAPEDRDRLERLSACLAPGSRWAEDDGEALQVESRDTLLDALPPERWDPCVQDFVRSRESAYPRMLQQLSVANTLVALDKATSRGIERTPRDVYRMIAVTRCALAPVGALSLRRDVEAITWRLGVVLHLRELLEPHEGLQVYVVRRYLLASVLNATQIVVAQIPPEVSLAPIVDLLAKIDDPVRDFGRALVEERAIGNEVFESLSSVDVHTPRPWSLESIWLDTDQAVYLDTLSTAIDAIDEPHIEQTEHRLAALDTNFRERAKSFWVRFTPVSMMLVPKIAEDWRRAEDQRVMLSLVRLALQVRGLEASLVRSTALLVADPWGRSMQSRVESDSVLVLWSLGPNGHDEGAPSALDPKVVESRFRGGEKMYDDIGVRVRVR